MAINIGQQLGNYRLIQLLGKGGFADVYLAEHSYLGTYAAIKVLDMRLTSDNIELFSKEARTIASLVHPHILRVLDFGIERGIPFLVMDYAPNGTLRQRHPRGSLLSVDTVISYVKQIASALQYIHERRLIHRDIKPENLLIGRNGEILIGDFGIAVMAHNSRSLNTEDASGTVYYMAPEQIQGKPRIVSDQYALGIVVYEWLCGLPPFSGTAMEIGMQHLLTPPQPLREKLLTISGDVEQIVLTALAKDPHQRYESVQGFADALEQASRLSIGTTICTYTGHSGKSVSAVWSPDSKYIASVSFDHWWENSIVQIWNATDGKQVHSYQIDDQPIGIYLAWISSIPQVASVKGEAVRIINILSEYDLNNFHCDFGFIHDLTWSPDGKFIATLLASEDGNLYEGYDGYSIGTIEVRDTSTGGIVGRYSLSEDSGPPPFAWSPDSTRIAFVPRSSEEGEISVWRVTSNSEVLSYRSQFGPVGHIVWSPDGKFIATGGNKMVRVLNAFTGDEVLTYLGHSQWVAAIAWSPDSQNIISASNNRSSVNGEYEDSIVHIWNASSGENTYTYRSQFGPVVSIVWSPDGKRIAITLGDGKVQIWRAA